MEAKVEAILREIYALEPSLRERDGEVRATVGALLEARPRIAPDSAFVARLKDEIITKQSAASRVAVARKEAQHDISWWAFRLAPVGLFAALTLALIGGTDGIYRDYTQSSIAPEDSEESSEIDTYATRVGNTAPGDGTDMSEQSIAYDSAMTMKMGPSADTPPSDGDDTALMTASGEGLTSDADTEATAGPRIEIGSHPSGSVIVITVVDAPVPSHVRFFAYEDDAPRAVIATTGVIPAGVQHEIALTTDRPMRDGEAIYAQAFASDGDAVFEPYQDLPLYDENGGFLSTIFVVTDELY